MNYATVKLSLTPRQFIPALLAVVMTAAVSLPTNAAGVTSDGHVELDVKSDYSHIRVRRKGSIRTMLFVRDDGKEVGETRMNINKPEILLAPYTRAMFASYLLRPRPKRVLIIGLGGGAMVHFLAHHEPDLVVDAVEIDPIVVKIAKSHFKLPSSDQINVITADAFDHLAATKPQTYDVIYMDAFLKPAADTDATGAPRRLRTVKFYKSVQQKLSPGGVVLFNLNRHGALREDVKTIGESFPQAYVFRVTGSDSIVVAGSMETRRAKLSTGARALNRRFKTNFSFQKLAKNLVRSE